MGIARVADSAIFVRVVEAGSLSAAGRALSMSPSAVSKIVTRLEDQLKARLMNRSSRALSLTPDGRAFYEKGLHILSAIEDAEAAVSPRGEPAGLLRVQSVPAFLRFQLAPHLPAFLARFPKLRVDVTLSTERADLVETGMDLAIYTGRLDNSGLIVRKIATSRWIICGAPTYFERAGVPTTPSQLAQHNCLCLPSRSVWHQWSFLIDDTVREVPITGSVICNQTDSLLEMAAAGLGLVRAAEFAVSGDLKSGRLIPVLERFADPNSQPIVALFQQRRNLSVRTRLFLEFLQETFSREPWRATYPALS